MIYIKRTMLTKEIEFKNEYDREITMSVKKIEKKSGERPGQRVVIKITGPDSVTENELTPLEAANLRKILPQ